MTNILFFQKILFSIYLNKYLQLMQTGAFKIFLTLYTIFHVCGIFQKNYYL